MTEPNVIEADLADPRHQHAIRRLLDDYARDPMGQGRPLGPDVLERLIPGLAEQPGSLVFIAMDAGEPVGLAVCFVGFSTFAGRLLINIHDFAVAGDRRGRGFGRAMLERIERKARELSCCKITLEVRSDNARARGLYQSFGFADSPSPDAVDAEFSFWTKALGAD